MTNGRVSHMGRLTTRFRGPLPLLLSAILSAIYYGYFFVSAMLAAVCIAVSRALVYPWDEDGRVAHTLTRWLAYHYIALNPGWKVRIEGREHLAEVRTGIMVANHQSMVDVLALAGLPAFYKWVAKAQIWRMLAVGQLMRINEYVPVAHGDLRSVRRMMRKSRRLLHNGVSLFIFPEGERSFDGELLDFKDGPFRLACESNAAVVPIVIDGTREILPRGAWTVNFRGEIVIRVLPPVYPASFGYDATAIRSAVRTLIQNELHESVAIVRTSSKKPTTAA